MSSIEVITLPVSVVDRSLRFYTEQVGFTLDVDWSPTPSLRVVQLTPPGSGCSVQLGVGLTDAVPGSTRGNYLVVEDLAATHERLLQAHVAISPVRHKTPIGNWDGSFAPGLDPGRGDYASFTDFPDPDGNTWIVQERGHRHD